MQWMKFSWMTTPKTPLSHLTYVYRDCKDFLSASCYSISYASISHIRSMNCIWQNFTVHAGWSLLHQLVHSQNIYENDGQLINQTCTCVSFCHCGVLYNFFIFCPFNLHTLTQTSKSNKPSSKKKPTTKKANDSDQVVSDEDDDDDESAEGTPPKKVRCSEFMYSANKTV